jgi:hypothetical protein
VSVNATLKPQDLGTKQYLAANRKAGVKERKFGKEAEETETNF